MASAAPVVVITGSALGIGFATGKKLSANGCNDAISGLNEGDVESVINGIKLYYSLQSPLE